MANSLSNLFDNLAEEIHKIKCKHGNDNKKCKKREIKHKDCECGLEYKHVKDDLILYTRLCCYKNFRK